MLYLAPDSDMEYVDQIATRCVNALVDPIPSETNCS